MIWGRLGYDPDMGNDRFEAVLQSTFPKVDGTKLFDAWQKASIVYPLTTGFHWGALDFQWYIECCQSRDMINRTPYRYNDINDFITLPPHPRSGNISIPDFVDAVSEDMELEGTTPYEVANALKKNAEQALSFVEGVKAGNDEELMKVLNDIRSLAYMGLFYGYKIQAAADLQFFRKRGNLIDRENAISALKTSIRYFKKYASNSMKINHNPLWTNRVGNVDWHRTYVWAMHDLKIVGADLDMESDAELSGAMVIEAENAVMDHGNVLNRHEGFSGEGYIKDARNVRFIFDVPKAGKYKVKFRYSINWESGIEKRITVNGAETEPFYFWNTGKNTNWTVDEEIYELKQGKNTIGIDWIHRFNLDQVGLEKVE
jgi:pterin-4a-carbinolamine dehydratase